LKLILNGDPLETSARTLGELIGELGYGEARVATALNGTFVPAAQRAGIALTAGDRIEVVTPRQGG
jgi:sulfur carrier protein